MSLCPNMEQIQKIVSEYDQEIQTRGTARKSRSTITRHQDDKLSYATSSLFHVKMIGRHVFLCPNIGQIENRLAYMDQINTTLVGILFSVPKGTKYNVVSQCHYPFKYGANTMSLGVSFSVQIWVKIQIGRHIPLSVQIWSKYRIEVTSFSIQIWHKEGFLLARRAHIIKYTI